MRTSPSAVVVSGLLALPLVAALSGCGGPSAHIRQDQPADGVLTLVRDGTPAATIVIAAEPAKAVVFAVEELNTHLEKITGVRLPVLAEDRPVAGTLVLVGDSAATRALGLTGADFEPQESLVRAGGDTLVLLGRDDFEPPVAAAADTLWVDGKWGKALHFDGATVLTAGAHGFDDAEGTLECWLFVDDQPALWPRNSDRGHAR